MVSIRFENVTKKFRDVMAVDNLNLEIRNKEFLTILGPSGGGKSSVLNIIAGLEPQSSGRVYFDEILIDRVPPERRDVAMVFQSYALYPHMNVFENVAFGLKLRKLSKGDINARVRETAASLNIDRFLSRRPHELSGGERQRVALARAIVRSPKAFLLDEPLSNIDAKLRVAMRAELIRLHKRLRTTFVYVTHDQVEAMTMADRIGVLNNGRLMQLGSPLEIFRKPENRFVAEFIGMPPMNFFECTLSQDGCLNTCLGNLKMPLDAPMDKVKSRGLVAGIRPQNVSVSKRQIEDAIAESEVYAVEPLGTETIVDLKVGDDVFKAVAPGDFSSQIGDRVWVSVDISKVHLFDKETEKCIV